MPVRPVFPGEGTSGSGTGAVNSVNGEQGDVIITAQDVNAQPVSSVLTDIAAITMPDNSFLHTDGSGNFTPSLCMPAGVAWLSYTTVDQQKDHLALARVASSGDYNDLVNKPTSMTIPTKTSELTNDSGFITSASVPAQVNADWNSTSGKSQILNKPVLFSGNYSDLTGKPALFSGSYADLTNKPTLFDGTYASLSGKPTSFPPAAHTHAIADVTGLQSSLDSKLNVGSSIPYSSLTGAPTIPAAQVNSDWNSTSGVSQILNKPVLFDGTYSSLTGKPTSFTPSAHTHAINDITGLQTALDGKVSTGSNIPYSVLTGTPVIPAAQIQSDWNQTNTASLDFIKNKPSIPVVSYPVTSVNTKTGAVVLTNTDVGAAATSHTHVIGDVTGLQASLDSKATTASLSNYVTSSALTTSLSGYATTTALTNGLSAKFNVPTGTVNQYIRGDGSLATLPSGTRTFTNPVRSLNNVFQISATQDVQVHYAVDITVGALVIGGQSGRVILEYADNLAMTTNVVTVNTGGNSTSGVLNITNLGTVSLSGIIPSGKYVRLRTSNVSGTPTYAFQNAQEILL